MGVPGNANALLLRSAAAAGGYQVSRSLRFNSADSAYLSRTPASAGNRKTWTWSAWVKRSSFAAFRSLFGSYDGSTGSTYFSLIFTTSDTLRVEDISTIFRETTQVFRDPSAWYHIVLSVDTTAGTANNRIRLYVNGTEITTFGTTNNPSSSADLGVNGTHSHGIGRPGAQDAYYFNGYMADIWFLDGIAATPSDFAETNATTSQWIPKAYTGSKGTNGFHLEFADNSAATATTLGKDAAGSNNWTPNNFSVTAGAGNDSLVDTPTSYGTDDGLGGSVRGNYATINPLSKAANATLSNGNLDVTNTVSGSAGCASTIGMSSGKWYCEVTVNAVGSETKIGICKENAIQSEAGSVANSWAYGNSGEKFNSNANTSYGNSFTTGDVIGIAFDADAGSLYFYKNGTVQNSGTAAYTSLTSGPYFFQFTARAVGSANNLSVNFGQRAWAYAAPANYRPVVDTLLATPVVAKPNTVMDVLVFAATNANNTSITGLNFQPDLVWGKSRTNAYSHQLYDSVRGVNKNLKSNTTGAEVTDTVGLTSFDSNGFTAGVDFNVILGSGSSVAWCWDAGTSTVTNTQGSITSSVRANPSSGFSIVTFNSGPNNGVNQTIGHGCGSAPQLIIIKSRTGNATWTVYHASATSVNQFLALDATNAVGTATNIWGAAAPTSTVFGFRSSQNQPQNTDCVAYVWAPVAGYSSMGSYVGNGSSDGVFVYTGHRIRFLLIKNTTLGGSNWRIIDTARNPYNVANLLLNPNSSNAEQTTTLNTIDLLSNGFKCRGTDGDTNSSGDTFIYYAVAENPFQYARAR